MFTLNKKVVYPACERNKKFILEVLQKYINPNEDGNMLEISSGTGQHVSFFAQYFPNLKFQPSEFEKSLFVSIKAYIDDTPTKNIYDPVKIDVTTDPESWKLPLEKFDYMLNVNLMHISPFSCTVGLFRNCGKLLKIGGKMFTYGPYAHNGIIEPQSNIDFDRGLRSQNSEWGLRDINDLKEIASEHGIKLLETHHLPSNNKCLVWEKIDNTKL